ncbi:unnamed protein product [Chondrus crispus]|uniref:Secreted protein n=1 Tax=Chondrus crispus TaxID=2769 RepID=R7QAS1_CHOCR|nr:unnamed protein product [Chondrus crispus]CDF35612.1 unnamed protein product [Chondrus crispus]|eukprot:XP_005715431.1 unnamed protein product [Chondrus crispus]
MPYYVFCCIIIFCLRSLLFVHLGGLEVRPRPVNVDQRVYRALEGGYGRVTRKNVLHGTWQAGLVWGARDVIGSRKQPSRWPRETLQ